MGWGAGGREDSHWGGGASCGYRLPPPPPRTGRSPRELICPVSAISPVHLPTTHTMAAMPSRARLASAPLSPCLPPGTLTPGDWFFQAEPLAGLCTTRGLQAPQLLSPHQARPGRRSCSSQGSGITPNGTSHVAPPYCQLSVGPHVCPGPSGCPFMEETPGCNLRQSREPSSSFTNILWDFCLCQLSNQFHMEPKCDIFQ